MRAAPYVAALALLVGGAARAVEPPETLIHGDVDHGGYAAPRVAFGRTAGHDSVMLGMEGAWIIEHHFLLGAAIHGLVSDQPAPGVYAGANNLIMGYGGLLIGSSLLPSRLVHPTFTLLVGGGGLGMRSKGDAGTTSLGDAFFVLEPSAGLDLNIVAFFRVNFAVSYRWVRSVDTDGITNADLSGVFGSLALKFGKF